MPFIITLLPLLGLGFLSSEPVEWGLLLCSATMGTLALRAGYREHGHRRVFAFLGVALCLLVAGRFLEEHHLHWWGPVVMVLGGFSMMGVHILNRVLCRSYRACNESGCCDVP